MNVPDGMIYTGAVLLVGGIAWFDIRLGLLAAGALLLAGGILIARQT